MSSPSEQRRLLAILVADIAGYSRMMAKDENGTYARLKALQNDVILPRVGSNNGEVVKWTGDGFIATFSSAVDAVRAAVEIQSSAHAANMGVPEDRQQRLRIGINVGDVIVVPGDVYGDAVNIAARLQGLAAEGGIAASQMVRDTVRGKFSVEFTDRGNVSVKNIPDPVRIFGIAFQPVAWAVDRPATSTGQPFSTAVRARNTSKLLRYGLIAAMIVVAAVSYRVIRQAISPPPQSVQEPQPAPASPTIANRPVASTPQVAPALPPENPPPTPAMRAEFAARVAALVPTMPADVREKLANDYFAAPANKAMAVAPPAGRTWRVANRPAAPIAVNEALEGCEITAGMPCGLVAQNDRVEPLSANGLTTIRPMPRVAYSGSFDATMIPTGDFRTTDLARAYAGQQGNKALALHPTGWIFGHSGGANQQETEKAALKTCTDDRKAKAVDGPCYLYAAGDFTVLAQRITTADEPLSAEADLMEGQWRGKLDNGKTAVVTVLGGRVVQFTLVDASQPVTKSTMDGKTISFGDRRYAVSMVLDGATEANVEFTGPGESAAGVLRKQ